MEQNISYQYLIDPFKATIKPTILWMVIRSHLKTIFWPNFSVRASS